MILTGQSDKTDMVRNNFKKKMCCSCKQKTVYSDLYTELDVMNYFLRDLKDVFTLISCSKPKQMGYSLWLTLRF